MKRQVTAIGLATFSAFSLLISQFAEATPTRVTITDRENNSRQTPQWIGTLKPNTIYTVNGSLGNRQSDGQIDLVDNYRFRISKAGRYVFALGGGAKAGSAELRLYKTTTLIANKKPAQPIDMVLQPGTYRLEVFRTPFAQGSFSYGTSIITPQS
ncbi:hypothetical protein [Leptothermofonsia sp. ETS-13]|uniref:hypothetical protein n=1 Tax=Leptothermofonsia sp. ETS-13 TaxID=3035696 RepID=UPI003B9EEA51